MAVDRGGALLAVAADPVGINEHGGWVMLDLVERNLLLGGEPGAGKSAILALLLAAAALDPSTVLYLFDGKLVELACWAGCARRTVGLDMTEAIGVLRELHAELDRRLLVLLANRRRKIAPELGLPLLVARGRAAGIIVIAATQKPSSDNAGQLAVLMWRRGRADATTPTSHASAPAAAVGPEAG